MVEKKKIDKKHRIKSLQAILTVLLLITCGYILWYRYDSYQSDKKLNEMKNITSSIKPVSSVDSVKTDKNVNNSFTEASSEIDKPNKEILDELNPLFEANKDLIGWLEIKDTKLSVPVVQGNNNEYYLEHDFYHKKDKRGTVFLDCNAEIKENPSNVIIYGHYVSDQSMFGALEGYKEKDFFKEHSTIEFNSLYERRSYEIISVFLSKVYDENGDLSPDLSGDEDEGAFRYYDFNIINSKDEFETYVDNVLGLSLIDTQKNAEYGDELITLSTCDYYTEDGRLVVVGKRVE